MEGSGWREGRGPMKSVNSRARKAASPPVASGWWQLATHMGNMRTRSASLVRSLPVRQSAGPQVRILPFLCGLKLHSVGLSKILHELLIHLFIHNIHRKMNVIV